MTIDREGTTLVITLPPKGEKNNRTEILSNLRGVMFTGWRGADEALYDYTAFSEESTALTLRLLLNRCKVQGYEISASAQEIFDEYENRLNAILEKKAEAERKEQERKNAIYLMTHGCGTCIGLRLDPEQHGEFICEVTGKRCLQKSWELEMGFETWKQTGRFPVLTPYPMQECPKIEILR